MPFNAKFPLRKKNTCFAIELHKQDSSAVMRFTDFFTHYDNNTSLHICGENFTKRFSAKSTSTQKHIHILVRLGATDKHS